MKLLKGCMLGTRADHPLRPSLSACCSAVPESSKCSFNDKGLAGETMGSVSLSVRENKAA